MVRWRGSVDVASIPPAVDRFRALFEGGGNPTMGVTVLQAGRGASCLKLNAGLVGGQMAPCVRVGIATRGGGGELRSVSSRGALWEPRMFLMLNEIEGLNGSTAAYVPGVGWNSIEGCYRSSSSFKY